MDEKSYKVYTNAFGETTFSESASSTGSAAHSPRSSFSTSKSVVKRAIFDDKDLESFKSSETCSLLLRFIQLCADAVVGKTNNCSAVCECQIPAVEAIERFMTRLIALVDEIPPLKQPMRFGNKAFRSWHQRLCEESIEFVRALLALTSSDQPVNDELVLELVAYLSSSFGNEVRIDYGTGHELNMAVFFYCLYSLNIVKKENLPALILRGFVSYIRVMRKLQTVYLLEPAGSHGVWGLDDYHCLTFVWGAAQLSKNDSDITPSSIHDAEILREFKDEYLYLEGIAFIRSIKSSAPFSETSPMLNDISGVSDWPRVTVGLMKLFQGEVLFKRPVVQHLPFGSILKCTWVPSESAESVAGSHAESMTFRPAGMSLSVGATARPRPISHHGPISQMTSDIHTAAPWALKK